RRIVFGCHREFYDVLLYEHETPELAGVKIVPVSECTGQRGFSRDHWEALERILPKVDDPGHVGLDLGAGPARRLHEELKLEVINAQRAKPGPGEVEQLVTGGRSLPFKQIHLIVPIKMVLVSPVA